MNAILIEYNGRTPSHNEVIALEQLISNLGIIGFGDVKIKAGTVEEIAESISSSISPTLRINFNTDREKSVSNIIPTVLADISSLGYHLSKFEEWKAKQNLAIAVTTMVLQDKSTLLRLKTLVENYSKYKWAKQCADSFGFTPQIVANIKGLINVFEKKGYTCF